MKKLLSIVFISVFLYACVKENNNVITNNFNRELVLTNWVNNLIIPAYADFKLKADDLKIKADAFVTSPNVVTQQELQTALFETQKKWQHVAMFELQGSTRIYINTYPIDRETSIIPFANSNEDDSTLQGNLEESTNFINQIDFINTSGTIDEQGFAVVDFLINQENVLTNFTTDEANNNYVAYLNKVIDRIVVLAETGNTYWITNATDIITYSGSDADASFDKMLNDYINYVEQGFRENKIANSSGKRDGIVNTKAVESYYSSEHSKEYFEEAFIAIQNFYYGTYYDGSETGAGLKTYLDDVNAEAYDADQNRDIAISELIENKFSDIQLIADGLDDDFVKQLENDSDKMITTFNVIQDYVVLIKVNVFQSLNVRIDYVDSDGD